MIVRGTMPRALGGRGLWVVLGLGALLLPTGARAQPPAKAEPDKKPVYDVIRLSEPIRVVNADASPDDLEKLKAELKQLEAMLAQKQAEVAEIAARVVELRAKMAKSAAPDGRRVAVWQAVPDGGNPAVLKDALQRLAASQPGGPGVKVIVIDAATGRIVQETNGPNPPLTPAQPPIPVRARLVLTPPMSEADKRIDDLEQKLKGILEEVEQLRRERKPGEPESRQESEGQRFRVIFNQPAQPENEQQAKELAAARDRLEKMLQELRAKGAEKSAVSAEEQAREAEIQARLKTAEVYRQAAEARVKQLEADLQKLKATSGDGPKKP